MHTFRRISEFSDSELVRMGQELGRSLVLGEQLNKLCWPNDPSDCWPILPNLQEIELLLKAGANPNIEVDKESKECLLHKCAYDDYYNPLAALLLKYDAYTRKGNSREQTPLHIAAAQGAVGNVKLFLQVMHVNSRFISSDTPLHSLAKNLIVLRPIDHKKHLEIAKLLLDAGADVTDANDKGETPITIISSKFLEHYPPIHEFHYLFRKKMAQSLLENLRSMRQEKAYYFSLLPIELIEQLSLYGTNKEYQTKPFIDFGFPGDI